MTLDFVLKRVLACEDKAGMINGSVRLIAVSKMQNSLKICEVLALGHKVFAENRVQEALEKWPALLEKFPDVRLDLIGSLQTNKVSQAYKIFQCIHTLDRDSLALACANMRQKQGNNDPVFFVQVNTGREPQKSGVFPEFVDEFLKKCRDVYDLPVVGLMTIPPFRESPVLHFQLLEKLAARNGLKRLSMGMSHDFEQAIAAGATDIRVGSCIFGQRA
jgi:pyridoxal phosphate enzyme (YggS family)